MQIFINTPTGNIGGALTHSLLEKGHSVQALHRAPGHLPASLTQRMAVTQGDLTDAASLASAMGGANALFWLTPPPHHSPSEDYEGWAEALANAACQAAREARVTRAVVVSAMGAQAERVGPVNALGRVERVFSAAGFTRLVVLRPGFFMENLLRDLDTIASRHAIYAPAPPQTTLPWVSVRDIAQVAERHLLDFATPGEVVQGVHGPEDLTFAQAAGIAGKVLGRPVTFVPVPADVARTAMREAGLAEFVAELFVEMYEAMGVGRLVAAEPRDATTTTPTRLENVVREVVAPALAAHEGRAAAGARP